MKHLVDLVSIVLGLLLCALVIVVALAIRIVYETVMLLPRVWRAERDGPVPEQPVQHHPV